MKKFGRYEIRKKLGRGGMGGVFLAYDPRLGREVAIKVIAGFVLDKNQSRERFNREAQVMAGLNHAAIVPIHDFGEQDGQPYLVMRLMRGGSLTDLLRKKGRFTLVEATELLERLAPALDMAHARGFVHRDLKPDNILLDQFAYPAITDFGLVKLLSASMSTKSGRIMGTPHYMSPEQARGDRDIDHRTDIYALGVILFQLLTGKWPYESDNAFGFIYRHNFEPIPQICDLNSDLPPECQAVIECALAKEREDRYNSVREFVEALQALQVVKSPVTPPASAVDYLKRGHEAYKQKNYELAIVEYSEALRLRPTYYNGYMSRGNVYYQSGEYGLAIADYEQALRITPDYMAAYYWCGRAKQEQGQLEQAINDYEQVLRINPKYVGAYYQRGLAQQEMGQLDLALADYEAALRINPNYTKAKTAQQAVAKQLKEAQEREEARKQEEARNPEEKRMKALLNDQAALKRLPTKERITLYVNLFNKESLQRVVPTRRRVEIGMELAQLGDPRPSVMTLDGMEFCYVPPGPFWMGSNREGNDNNKPLHKVDIPVGYWIGRYPVTNAQFQTFVDDGGYRHAAFWTEAKKQGYWKDAHTKDWSGWRDAPYDYGTPYTLPNHPRVGVTWYEALAFTRWLSKQWLNAPARLPSEAEWEKAARGGLEIPVTPLIRRATKLTPLSSLRMTSNPLTRRNYPWSNDFDANLTNCLMSGIGHTNAVGSFLMAKSPYGAEEMSGNVWEWCQSQWQKYDYSPEDGREKLNVYAPRVIRGGSYYNNNTTVSCFFRSRYGPSNFHLDRGFRVFLPR